MLRPWIACVVALLLALSGLQAAAASGAGDHALFAGSEPLGAPVLAEPREADAGVDATTEAGGPATAAATHAPRPRGGWHTPSPGRIAQRRSPKATGPPSA